jgi:hypothetical protein
MWIGRSAQARSSPKPPPERDYMRRSRSSRHRLPRTVSLARAR